jgi:hypothetical protein
LRAARRFDSATAGRARLARPLDFLVVADHPAEKAFYYARVIEIPTPRWTAYDAYRYGVPLPKGDSGIHQERAYTSPIWYAP